MIRLPTLLGALAGVLVGLVALVLLAASLGPAFIEPEHETPAFPTATGTGSAGPGGSAASVEPAGSSPPPGPSGSPAVGLRVGDVAPPLVVPQVGGGSIDLSTVRGKPVWVSFTASWCPSCRDELALMDKALVQLGDRLAIIAVDVKEDPDTAASLVSQTGFVAPMGIDRDGAAQAAWNAYVLPIHYWLDKDGVVRAVLYGSGGPAQFAAGIRSVLPGATFSP